MRKEGNYHTRREIENAAQLHAFTSGATSAIFNYIIIKSFVTTKVNFLYMCAT